MEPSILSGADLATVGGIVAAVGAIVQSVAHLLTSTALDRRIRRAIEEHSEECPARRSPREGGRYSVRGLPVVLLAVLLSGSWGCSLLRTCRLELSGGAVVPLPSDVHASSDVQTALPCTSESSESCELLAGAKLVCDWGR